MGILCVLERNKKRKNNKETEKAVDGSQSFLLLKHQDRQGEELLVVQVIFGEGVEGRTGH